MTITLLTGSRSALIIVLVIIIVILVALLVSIVVAAIVLVGIVCISVVITPAVCELSLATSHNCTPTLRRSTRRYRYRYRGLDHEHNLAGLHVHSLAGYHNTLGCARLGNRSQCLEDDCHSHHHNGLADDPT